MPTRNRAIRVPLDLSVVVGVQVDEARRDNQPVGVEQLVGVGRIHLAANLGDHAIFDPDIGNKSGDTGPIDHSPPANQNVKFCHQSLQAIQGVRVRASVGCSEDKEIGTKPCDSGELIRVRDELEALLQVIFLAVQQLAFALQSTYDDSRM